MTDQTTLVGWTSDAGSASLLPSVALAPFTPRIGPPVPVMKIKTFLVFTAALMSIGVASSARAARDKDSLVTAVFSRCFNDYKRPAESDGSPKILTYNIAKGGYAPGMGKDASIDDVKFEGVVRVLGKYLAKQGYFPAKDGSKADVMMVVHWGKTAVDKRYRDLFDLGMQYSTGDAFGSEAAMGMMLIQFSQQLRNADNEDVANILGYTSEINYRNPQNTTALNGGVATLYWDLMDDLENERYYVTITAYDFQQLVQHKQKHGLWRTVISIDARENRFDERLTQMIAKASRYFGRDSGRLIRQFDYVPRVDFGELKSLGVVESKPATKE